MARGKKGKRSCKIIADDLPSFLYKLEGRDEDDPLSGLFLSRMFIKVGDAL